MHKITILTHIYYDNSLEYLKDYLLNFKKYNANYLFNINLDCGQKEQAIIDIKNNFPEAFIIETPNIGKDIGGKLALIDLYLRLNIQSDYLILLHDKLSPHSPLGERWRNKLFRVIEPMNIDTIIELFEKDKKTGIVSSKEFIVNEYNKKSGTFESTSASILKELIAEYSLNLATHDFVGGTMFWIRAEIINSFFVKYSPLSIRGTLEKGNVLDHNHGSTTHAWERMLSWIAIDQGYYINGI